jgi:hypothetical protein
VPFGLHFQYTAISPDLAMGEKGESAYICTQEGPPMPDLSPEDMKKLGTKIQRTPAPAKGAPPEEAPNDGAGDDADEPAQDALESIADSLALITRHLCAVVYLMRTSTEEVRQVTGTTFIHEVFDSIYDDHDPFKEVEDFLASEKALAQAAKDASTGEASAAPAP